MQLHKHDYVYTQKINWERNNVALYRIQDATFMKLMPFNYTELLHLHHLFHLYANDIINSIAIYLLLYYYYKTIIIAIYYDCDITFLWPCLFTACYPMQVLFLNFSFCMLLETENWTHGCRIDSTLVEILPT